MANAKTDSNQIPTMLGLLNSDGETPTLLKINPTTHGLDVSNGTSGSDVGRDTADHDDNQRTTMCATDANGAIIPLWINSSGQLLIKST